MRRELSRRGRSDSRRNGGRGVTRACKSAPPTLQASAQRAYASVAAASHSPLVSHSPPNKGGTGGHDSVIKSLSTYESRKDLAAEGGSRRRVHDEPDATARTAAERPHGSIALILLIPPRPRGKKSMDYLMMIIRELEKERNRIKRRMLRRIGKGKQIQEETNPEAPKAEGTGKAVRADIFLVLRPLPAHRPPAARQTPQRADRQPPSKQNRSVY